MIYITGDTHIPINIHKLNTTHFPQQKNMTGDDYIIICGDFGGVWDNSSSERYWINWLNNKNFTTLFIDGNHENFNLLNEYNVEKFCGGNVHKVSSKVFHLMRGQVYNIDGQKIFTMGGASSHDKIHRVLNKSWWEQEITTKQEFDIALENLDRNDWNVNHIITHCAPTSIQKQINSWYEKDDLTNFLELIKNNCRYDRWYFGHYHIDETIDLSHNALYHKILLLGNVY